MCLLDRHMKSRLAILASDVDVRVVPQQHLDRTVLEQATVRVPGSGKALGSGRAIRFGSDRV